MVLPMMTAMPKPTPNTRKSRPRFVVLVETKVLLGQEDLANTEGTNQEQLRPDRGTMRESSGFQKGKQDFSKCELVPLLKCYWIGVAVLRRGLKKGVLTTFASTRWRLASTVTSNCSGVPGFV